MYLPSDNSLLFLTNSILKNNKTVINSKLYVSPINIVLSFLQDEFNYGDQLQYINSRQWLR